MEGTSVRLTFLSLAKLTAKRLISVSLNSTLLRPSLSKEAKQLLRVFSRSSF